MTGTALLTVTIPGCPDPALSPNSRRDCRARAAIARGARRDAFLVTRSEIVTQLGELPTVLPRPLTLDVTIRWAKGRHLMDDDNAWTALKPTRDGIADALWLDDRQFICGTLTQEHDPSGRGEIVVTITEASGERRHDAGAAGGIAD